MDRSLKWRTGILFAILLYCVVMVLPTIVGKTSLPGWFRAVSDNEINLGLDLQGGLYIVYDIDVAKAIDDRASEIKRDLDAKFADESVKGTVKTPSAILGGVTITLADASKKSAVEKSMESDYGDMITTIPCPATDSKDAVSSVPVSRSLASLPGSFPGSRASVKLGSPTQGDGPLALTVSGTSLATKASFFRSFRRSKSGGTLGAAGVAGGGTTGVCSIPIGFAGATTACGSTGLGVTGVGEGVGA